MNNCATCDHKKRPDGGYCYMFRKEPEGVCMQHTERKATSAAPLFDHLRRLRASGQGPAA